MLKTAESGYPNLDMAVTRWTSDKRFGAISINPLVPTSRLRMPVGGRGMFVGEFAMFERRSYVLLRLFVLPDIVMMSRLMVMMRGGVVVCGCLMMMLTRRMLRSLCHLRESFLRMNTFSRPGERMHPPGDLTNGSWE